MLNNSLMRLMGRSELMDPSLHFCRDGQYGTKAPAETQKADATSFKADQCYLNGYPSANANGALNAMLARPEAHDADLSCKPQAQV